MQEDKEEVKSEEEYYENLSNALFENYLMKNQRTWCRYFDIGAFGYAILTLIFPLLIIIMSFMPKSMNGNLYILFLLIPCFIIIFLFWFFSKKNYCILNKQADEFHFITGRSYMTYYDKNLSIRVSKRGYKILSENNNSYFDYPLTTHKPSDILQKGGQCYIEKNSLVFHYEAHKEEIVLVTTKKYIPLMFVCKARHTSGGRFRHDYKVNYFSHDETKGKIYLPIMLKKAFEENNMTALQDDRIEYLEWQDYKKAIKRDRHESKILMKSL